MLSIPSHVMLVLPPEKLDLITFLTVKQNQQGLHSLVCHVGPNENDSLFINIFPCKNNSKRQWLSEENLLSVLLLFIFLSSFYYMYLINFYHLNLEQPLVLDAANEAGIFVSLHY